MQRAAADSWFSHIAVEVPGEETGNEWCEPVDDEAYGKCEENFLYKEEVYEKIYFPSAGLKPPPLGGTA